MLPSSSNVLQNRTEYRCVDPSGTLTNVLMCTLAVFSANKNAPSGTGYTARRGKVLKNRKAVLYGSNLFELDAGT